MAGEGQLTLSATGFTRVNIWCTKIDHNFDKPLFDIQVPSTKNNQESQVKPKTWIIDIGRVKELITVQGMLIDESTESAVTKKWNLVKMVRYGGGTITISWGTGNNAQTDKDKNEAIEGDILKLGVTETAGIIGIQESGYFSDKNFAVQLSLLVGKDKLA